MQSCPEQDYEGCVYGQTCRNKPQRSPEAWAAARKVPGGFVGGKPGGVFGGRDSAGADSCDGYLHPVQQPVFIFPQGAWDGAGKSGGLFMPEAAQ